MEQAIRMLTGAGVGAGLMYFLDPDRGRGRRAMARDKFVRLSHETRHAADIVARDAANRTHGLWARMRSVGDGETPSDRVLVARVRSQLGRCVSHPRAVTVTSEDGTVTLAGPILAREVDHLLACAARVPGVRGVQNRLEVHPTASDHPALQGGIPRTGDRGGLFQESWSPTLRVAAGAAGVGLMGNCLAQRNLVSALLGTVGFGLFLRAAANASVSGFVGRMIPAGPASGGPSPRAVAAAGPVL